jgi:hypothetical protein
MKAPRGLENFFERKEERLISQQSQIQHFPSENFRRELNLHPGEPASVMLTVYI